MQHVGAGVRPGGRVKQHDLRQRGSKRSGSGTNKLTPLFLPWFEKVGRALLVTQEKV